MTGIAATNSKIGATIQGDIYIDPETLTIATDLVPGVETAIILRGTTKRFILTSRGTHTVKYRYTLIDAQLSLYPNSPLIREKIRDALITVYVQSTGASQPLELETWI